MSKIPITQILVGAEEEEAILKPLRSGWVVQGQFVSEFEQKFATFTQIPYASATTSCTTALHIAMSIMDLSPGDEVIVPAFTWISTANVVEYMGAKPIFCDVNLDSFNIDVEQIEALITPKTVGIIPVHLFGLAADMNKIKAIAEKHHLWIVEDAACGFGASYHGQHVGAIGDLGCFSFHPRKSITTGEGGMITTQSAEYDRLGRALRDHGAERSDLQRHNAKQAFLLAEYNHLGFNYRMTDLQGALGSVQMDRAEMILTARRRLAAQYDSQIADLEWLQAPLVPSGYEHGYQAYVTLFTPEKPSLENAERLHEQRNALMLALEEKGIATRQGTHAAALQNYYTHKYGLTPQQFPNAYLAELLTITLPLYPQMTDDEQGFVLEELKKAYEATSTQLLS